MEKGGGGHVMTKRVHPNVPTNCVTSNERLKYAWSGKSLKFDEKKISIVLSIAVKLFKRFNLLSYLRTGIDCG